jgi:hypothetical protein
MAFGSCLLVSELHMQEGILVDSCVYLQASLLPCGETTAGLRIVLGYLKLLHFAPIVSICLRSSVQKVILPVFPSWFIICLAELIVACGFELGACCSYNPGDRC